MVARLECVRLARECLIRFGEAVIGEHFSASGTGGILDELRCKSGLFRILHRRNP